MRLPQSTLQHLFVRTVHFLTIGMATTTLLGIAPISAGAGTPQLVCAPSSLRFGEIAVGQTETLMVTVTNNGTTSVTVTAITRSSSLFTTSSLSLPLVLLAGQSVDLNVSFAPTSIAWSSATVKFTSNASNPTLTLGVGGGGESSESVTASPSAVSFGQVLVGASATVPVVLKNTRTRNVTLSSVQASGNGFSLSGATFPMTLGAGQSVTVNATFTPPSAGTIGSSLYVAGPALGIPLTGTGTTPGQLTIAPAPLSFGNVTVGTTGMQAITMSAAGASVTVSSASSSGSQFALNGASFPLTIAAGQSASFNVGFTPQNSGTASGSLSFASNASNPVAVESLSGVGTAVQHSVNLWWNASADVAGYNVYRSTTTNGTYSKINSTLEANAAYTDSTVASGQTYYYAATSVTSSGQESARSTPVVQAVVP